MAQQDNNIDRPKTVIFVRHGESLAQTARKRGLKRTDRSLRDCDLTMKGQSQAKGLRKLPCFTDGIDLVVVSPLTRALRTAKLGFQDVDAPFVCYPGIKERGSGLPENRPRKLKDVLRDFPSFSDIDFGLLPKEWPEHDVPDYLKLGRFLSFLSSRPEKRIVVVAHYNVIKMLLPRYGKGVVNCLPIVRTLDVNGRLRQGGVSTCQQKASDAAQESSIKSDRIRISFCERPDQKKANFVKVFQKSPVSTEILKAAQNKIKALMKKKRGNASLLLYRISDGRQVRLNEARPERLSWLENGDAVCVQRI